MCKRLCVCALVLKPLAWVHIIFYIILFNLIKNVLWKAKWEFFLFKEAIQNNKTENLMLLNRKRAGNKTWHADDVHTFFLFSLSLSVPLFIYLLLGRSLLVFTFAKKMNFLIWIRFCSLSFVGLITRLLAFHCCTKFAQENPSLIPFYHLFYVSSFVTTRTQTTDKIKIRQQKWTFPGLL